MTDISVTPYPDVADFPAPPRRTRTDRLTLVKKVVPEIDVVMGLQPAALLSHAHTKPARSRRIILDAIPELPAAA